MTQVSRRGLLCSSIAFVLAAAGARAAEPAPAAPAAPASIADAITGGKAHLDFRYRFENVDQEPFSKDANASTLRSRLIAPGTH